MNMIIFGVCLFLFSLHNLFLAQSKFKHINIFGTKKSIKKLYFCCIYVYIVCENIHLSAKTKVNNKLGEKGNE